MLPPSLQPSHHPILISPPPDNSLVLKIRPSNSLSSSTKLDFVCGKFSEAVVSLKDTLLGITFKIVKKNGEPMGDIAVDKKLSTLNDVHSAIQSSINVSINNVVVSHHPHQAFYAHLVGLLNTEETMRTAMGSCYGFEAESVGATGAMTSAAFKHMQKKIAKSKEVFVINKLHHPLFMQNKYLCINTELAVTLELSSADFFLFGDATDELKIEVVDAFLSLRLVRLETSMLNELNTSLAKSAYIIPFMKCEMRAITLGKGLSSFNFNSLFLGSLPSRVIGLMVENDAFLGARGKSPFVFKPHSLLEYSFMFNGYALPAPKIPFDTSEKNVAELFYYTCQTLGLDLPGGTTGLTFEKYQSEMFLFAQSFVRDAATAQATLVGTPGNISLNLRFKDALTQSLTLLLLADYHTAAVSIDHRQNTVSVI
jgi:hypothetical protein